MLKVHGDEWSKLCRVLLCCAVRVHVDSQGINKTTCDSTVSIFYFYLRRLSMTYLLDQRDQWYIFKPGPCIDNLYITTAVLFLTAFENLRSPSTEPHRDNISTLSVP